MPIPLPTTKHAYGAINLTKVQLLVGLMSLTYNAASMVFFFRFGCQPSVEQRKMHPM